MPSAGFAGLNFQQFACWLFADVIGDLTRLNLFVENEVAIWVEDTEIFLRGQVLDPPNLFTQVVPIRRLVPGDPADLVVAALCCFPEHRLHSELVPVGPERGVGHGSRRTFRRLRRKFVIPRTLSFGELIPESDTVFLAERVAGLCVRLLDCSDYVVLI